MRAYLLTSMLALTPSEVRASQDLVSQLGPFPILQFFAALIILTSLALGAYVWQRGEKMGKRAAAIQPQDTVTEVYFSGPLKAIYDSLQSIKSGQDFIRSDMREHIIIALRDSRHLVLNKMHETQLEIISEVGSTVTRVGDQIERLHHNLNEMRELVVRMEVRDQQTHEQLLRQVQQMQQQISSIEHNLGRRR